ncbi:hypothetical protein NLJ89_g4892 [Agrocybe chaxingu]|uniref:Uncharacterized protein n=1 Tax=Agrocybe chaxingu TaxID=84603 RepID=A0A9W8K2C3_9AGAR|nr:hypothetical protein NLJ89_g4892 [Agrocybe chaxingu]
MTDGPVIASPNSGFLHLVKRERPWYKNNRKYAISLYKGADLMFFWVSFKLVFSYLFITETKNRSLEETAILFDGNDAVKKLSEKAASRAGILR